MIVCLFINNFYRTVSIGIPWFVKNKKINIQSFSSQKIKYIVITERTPYAPFHQPPREGFIYWFIVMDRKCCFYFDQISARMLTLETVVCFFCVFLCVFFCVFNESKTCLENGRNWTMSGEVGKDMGQMIATILLQCLQDWYKKRHLQTDISLVWIPPIPPLLRINLQRILLWTIVSYLYH